ncbi:MAG: hypothetical protein ACI9J3_001554 [Parvicellaceae bacterium]|jgi:hypothetical protein
MRELITILFCCISYLGISKTNESEKQLDKANPEVQNFLYETYFKRLYKYEPSLIRENKIEILKITMNRNTPGVEDTSNLKQKVTFRKDGRPKQMVEWHEYYATPTIIDYSYDSLGNLVEYRHWTSVGYPSGTGKADREVERIFFNYHQNQLTNVFNYSQRNSNKYLTLNYCDSLSYQLENLKVTIIKGNGNHINIRYQSNPRFVYPINKNSIREFITEKPEPLVELPGQEILRNKDCPYSNKTLIMLQEITGRKCLPKEIINACNEGLFWSMESTEDTLEVIFDRSSLSSQKNTVYIDTVGQEIFVKSHYSMSEPTSLENRITSTFTTQIYDYALILRQTNEIRESSRGIREYSKDSSQTYFTYFDFGLMQGKEQIHYYPIIPSDTGALDHPEKPYYRISTYREETRLVIWE